MNSLLSKFSPINRQPITDDQYRESITINSTAILNMLFDSLPDIFFNLESINILVVGAGFFPSFQSFINTLTKRAPKLTRLHFILIEPEKTETDRFERYFIVNNFATSYHHYEISYSVHNEDIKKYLQESRHTAVDIVYFEQPDLSPIGILLAKNGSTQAKLNLSLRESVPYLKKIIQPYSIIIASCLFKRDLTQLNALINFSLKIPTKRKHLPALRSNGIPYNCGLISIIDTQKLPNKNPQDIAHAIKRNDNYYSLLLVISFIIFLATPPIGKIPSLIVTLALMFYHRYGIIKNLVTKLILIASQLSILVMTMLIIKQLH